MSQRYEFLKLDQLDKIERTPEGFLRLPAKVTRTGIFIYRKADGSLVRELRKPEEVFNADSLASILAKPFTNNHPSEGSVDSQNATRHTVGFTSDSVQEEGKFVKVFLNVLDENTIKDIENGKREVSCGYRCKVLDESGVFEGERFDAIQTEIRYNHISLVDRGRGGPEVRVSLDSDDAVLERSVLDNEDSDENTSINIQDFINSIRNDQERELQTVIISKEIAKTQSEARKIAQDFGITTKIDPTGTSFRFQQKNPGRFKDDSFKSFPVPGKKGVTLVFAESKGSSHKNEDPRKRDEISHRTIRDQLHDALHDNFAPGVDVFMRDVFSDHFIFSVGVRDTLFKQNYRITNDIVELEGNAEQVIKKVEFIKKEDDMELKTIKIDEKEIQVPSEHADALTEFIKTLKEKVDSLEKDQEETKKVKADLDNTEQMLDKVNGKVAGYKASIAELEKKFDEFDAKVVHAAHERTKLQKIAETVLDSEGLEKLDGMKAIEIKKAIITKKTDLDLKESSDEYVDSCFDVICKLKEDAKGKLGAAIVGGRTDSAKKGSEEKTDHREKAMDKQKNAWKRKED